MQMRGDEIEKTTNETTQKRGKRGSDKARVWV